MAELAPKLIQSRAKDAWQTKSQWHGLLDEVFSLALPYRNSFSEGVAGSERMENVYDSTALVSTIRFAGRLQQDLTPPGQMWFKLEAGPAITDEEARDELNAQLELVTKIVHQVLGKGSFFTANHEFYLELAATSAIMAIDDADDEELMRFRCLPQGNVATVEGPLGVIDQFYFNRGEVEIALIQEVWPDAVLTEKLKETLAQQQDGSAAKTKICEAVCRDYSDNVWRYYVWSVDDDEQYLTTREYRSQPWIAGRYFKLPGESQARGPLLLALPDIRTLNAVVEMVLENAALAIAGVYLVADGGSVNPANIEIAPAAFIPVQRTGGALGASITPLQSTHNFDVASLVLEDLRMNVKRILLDNQLPPQTGAVRSPTEIVARQRELFQETAGAIGRLINEFLKPLVERVIDLLAQKKLLPFRLRIDELLVKMQVISPLAQAQALENVEKVVQWLSLMQTLGGREIMFLAARIEDVFRYIGEQLGVPSELSRDKEEREAIMALVAQFIAQSGAGLGAVTGGPAANDAAPDRAALQAGAPNQLAA